MAGGQKKTRTAAGVGQDKLVEEHSEKCRGDVDQRSDRSVRSSSGIETPDGDCHKARTNITGGVSGDWMVEGRQSVRETIL